MMNNKYFDLDNIISACYSKFNNKIIKNILILLRDL